MKANCFREFYFTNQVSNSWRKNVDEYAHISIIYSSSSSFFFFWWHKNRCSKKKKSQHVFICYRAELNWVLFGYEFSIVCMWSRRYVSSIVHSFSFVSENVTMNTSRIRKLIFLFIS